MSKTITAAESGTNGSDPDDTNVGRLFGSMYRELHGIAHGQKRRMWGQDTLNTTALVHEAYLKLVDQSVAQWSDGRHFRAAAATAMRHILINYAQRKSAHKRGGELRQTTLQDLPDMSDERTRILLDLGEIMTTLENSEPRLSQVVDCRFFAGMTESEVAQALGVTERTIRRDWVRAKALLAGMLSSRLAESAARPHALGAFCR